MICKAKSGKDNEVQGWSKVQDIDTPLLRRSLDDLNDMQGKIRKRQWSAGVVQGPRYWYTPAPPQPSQFELYTSRRKILCATHLERAQRQGCQRGRAPQGEKQVWRVQKVSMFGFVNNIISIYHDSRQGYRIKASLNKVPLKVCTVHSSPTL